jgi:hypothetical protein
VERPHRESEKRQVRCIRTEIAHRCNRTIPRCQLNSYLSLYPEYDEFVQWLSLGSKEEKHILRKEKFFKLLAGVLPNRSPMSCYRFVLRSYNSFNHQGEWTPEDVERLLNLVAKYGRQWVRIGKEMGRTSDNVYDKYRSIGEEGTE